MAQFEIISEEESGRAWVFRFQVLDDGGSLTQHTVILTWADYNLWSGDGADPPAKVAEAAIAFLLWREGPDALAGKFDASIARRRHPDADERIPQLISR